MIEVWIWTTWCRTMDRPMTMLITDGLGYVYRARRCGWIIEISIINGPELQGVVSNDTMCDVGREGSTSGGVFWASTRHGCRKIFIVTNTMDTNRCKIVCCSWGPLLSFLHCIVECHILIATGLNSRISEGKKYFWLKEKITWFTLIINIETEGKPNCAHYQCRYNGKKRAKYLRKIFFQLKENEPLVYYKYKYRNVRMTKNHIVYRRTYNRKKRCKDWWKELFLSSWQTILLFTLVTNMEIEIKRKSILFK